MCQTGRMIGDFRREINNEIDRQHLEECDLLWPSDLFLPLLIIALSLIVVYLATQ